MRKKEMIKRWIYGIVGSLVLCVGTVSAQRTLSLEECREKVLAVLSDLHSKNQ